MSLIDIDFVFAFLHCEHAQGGSNSCSCSPWGQTLFIFTLKAQSHCFFRHYSDVPKVMSAWQIHDYGEVDKLKLSQDIEVPVVKKPDDVLVEVHAASVSPVDVKNMGQSVCMSVSLSCLYVCYVRFNGQRSECF